MLVVIPARGGSRRIPRKALKKLAGRSLLEWAIDRARASGYPFVVASEDTAILRAAKRLEAPTWKRNADTATDDAPDYSWARQLPRRFPRHRIFGILRITSPFLGGEHLEKAWSKYILSGYTSVRCVVKAPCHPAKMWTLNAKGIGRPVMKGRLRDGTPYHSSPTQALPKVYLQTAGLEIVSRDTLKTSLAGDNVGLYEVSGPAALDLNTLEDWAKAEEIAKTWTL